MGTAELGEEVFGLGIIFKFLLPRGTGFTPSKDFLPKANPKSPPIKPAISMKISSMDMYPEDFFDFLVGSESTSGFISEVVSGIKNLVYTTVLNYNKPI